MSRRESASRIGYAPNVQENSTALASGRERKRIQVACLRCRKRKIKCTGISIEGCSSCRSHGIPARECVVRRAGSTAFLEVKPEVLYPPPHVQLQSTSYLPAYVSQPSQYWQYGGRAPAANGSEPPVAPYPFTYNGNGPEQYSVQSMSVSNAGGAYEITPIHATMNYDFDFTPPHLPSLSNAARLPPMSTEDVNLPTRQAPAYRSWGGWPSGHAEGYGSTTTARPSYIADMYEQTSQVSTGGYASNISPPYLLPAVAPAPAAGTGMHMNSMYGHVSRPCMSTQPSLYGYGSYQQSEHDQQPYASLTMG